jgi:FdhD protein
MSRRRVERVFTQRVDAGGEPRLAPDRLIVEEPMTIQLDGAVVATTMRTPGHDYELAVGFCHTEGLLAGSPVSGVRYCADRTIADGPNDFNTVTVETGGRAPTPTPRLGNVSSSCGWCGSDQLDALVARLTPLPAAEPIGGDVLAQVAGAVREQQELFVETGAVHAAAVFDGRGSIELVREDVGRHNAVDKVIGAMVLAGDVPATGRGLFVSGRASIEMVQKAWAGGFTTMLAVSAPTALAVDAARRAGLQLVGFVRDGSFNVYSPAP